MSGPQCCQNPPTLSSTAGAGSVIDFGGLKTYVSGYQVPNLRKLADKVAAAGFYVVVPDFFYGDPYDPSNTEKSMSVWKTFHEPAEVFEDSKPIIEALKSKGMTAIGAAGFCYGAKIVVELTKIGLVQAGVMLHPSFVTVDDIKEVKAAVAILGGEFDDVSPPELLKKFVEILSTKPEIPSFVKVFPGVGHGWSLRYRADDEKAVKAAEEAHQDMLNWLIKYVK